MLIDRVRVFFLSLLVLGILTIVSLPLISPGNSITAALSYGDTEGSPVFLLIFSTVIVITVFVVLLLVWEFGIPSHKLQRNLRKISENVHNHDLEQLKKIYGEIYTLYQKLSQKEQEKYFNHLERLKDFIEGQLQAKKEIEEHLFFQKDTSIEEKKRKYIKAHEVYQRMSAKQQESYYQHLMAFKQQLEHGRV